MKAGFPGRAQRSKMNVDCVKFQCKEFSLFFLFLNGIEPNWITLLKIKFYFMVFSIFNQNIFSVHQKWRFEQPIPHIFDPQLSSVWGLPIRLFWIWKIKSNNYNWD